MAKENARLIEIREDEKELIKIAKDAQDILDKDHKILISMHDAIPTICYVYLKEVIKYLDSHKVTGSNISLNMMQLFDMGVSYRENVNAEKEENFTPFLTPGQEFKLTSKADEEEE